MGKVSRIPTIGDYTIFFNSLFFVLYSEQLLKRAFVLWVDPLTSRVSRIPGIWKHDSVQWIVDIPIVIRIDK